MKRDTLSTCLARYQIVVTLANKLPSVVDRLGKTATQKSIFLLQELYGLEPLYDFEFYNFGVFSRDIAFDLDSAQNMELIEIRPFSTGYGVEIAAKINSDSPIVSGVEPAENLEAAINNFSDDYPNATLSRLELDSTVVYIDRDVIHRGELIDVENLVSRTIALKPKFQPEEVEESINRLRGKLGALQS